MVIHMDYENNSGQNGYMAPPDIPQGSPAQENAPAGDSTATEGAYTSSPPAAYNNQPQAGSVAEPNAYSAQVQPGYPELSQPPSGYPYSPQAGEQPFENYPQPGVTYNQPVDSNQPQYQGQTAYYGQPQQPANVPYYSQDTASPGGGYGQPYQEPGYNQPGANQQGGYYPNTYYPGYALQGPVPGKNKAVAALILGISGFVLCWFLIPAPLTLILGIVGVILAAQARKEMPPNQSGLATAGLVLSIISAVLGAVLSLLFLIVFAAAIVVSS